MNKKRFKKYYRTVKFLESLSTLSSKQNYMVHRNDLDIYLKRMRYFLNLLDNPDRWLNFIHITGTSGKGTVTNMLHEVIYSSGVKVGSFTSPFVTTSIEKIKINDKYISMDDFVKIVEKMKPAIKQTIKSKFGAVSYFEVFFAISLVYFRQQKCDWVVLEVGLGGRYDATNVIENPVFTAITNIDYDHTEILGKTLTKIARDKAGIIKKGSTFFTSENRKSILKIFKNICTNHSVEFNAIQHSRDYMKNNILLVTNICKKIGIKDSDIHVGISKSRLQCRFEIIQNDPTIIIDGAHNKAKIKSTIDNLRKIKYNKLHLVIAISQNKDHLAILKQLIPVADNIYFTKFMNRFRKCADPESLINLSKNYFKKDAIYMKYTSSKKATSIALQNADKSDIILITGSFFLAGEIRKLWYPEEEILEKRNAFDI